MEKREKKHSGLWEHMHTYVHVMWYYSEPKFVQLNMPKLLSMIFFIMCYICEASSHILFTVNTFWSSVCFIVWILYNSVMFWFSVSVLEKCLTSIKKLQGRCPRQFKLKNWSVCLTSSWSDLSFLLLKGSVTWKDFSKSNTFSWNWKYQYQLVWYTLSHWFCNFVNLLFAYLNYSFFLCTSSI